MPTNDKPPAGMLLNPAVVTEARRRGWGMTPAALADAAKLAGIDLHIEASDDAARQGIAAITGHQRQTAERAAGAAAAERLARENTK